MLKSGSPHILNSTGTGQYLDALSVDLSKCMVNVQMCSTRDPSSGGHKELWIPKKYILSNWPGGGGG